MIALNKKRKAERQRKRKMEAAKQKVISDLDYMVEILDVADRAQAMRIIDVYGLIQKIRQYVSILKTNVEKLKDND